MKRISTAILCAAVSLTVSAQVAENYKINVGQFNKLKVHDNVNVVYRCNPDSSGFVQYRGAKEFADAFILTPKGGTLRIQVSTEDVNNPALPVLYVYSDFLTEVENSGLKRVTVENPAPCAEFKAKCIGNGSIVVENIEANVVRAAIATGNGTVNLSGSCREAGFRMLGTGVIAADRLRADDVDCRILGGGTIGCWPTLHLSVKGIGSTKIYYKGTPTIKKSGGGKLFQLPGERTFDEVMTDGQENDEMPDEVTEEEPGDE